MKKMLLMSAAMVAALPVFADKEVVNGIEWAYTVSDGVASLGLNSSGASASAVNRLTEGDIIVPETLGGFPVEIVGQWAFYNCSNLTSVTLPSTIRQISWNVFGNCVSLTNMVIPANVTSISGFAFGGCKGLTSFVVEDGNPRYSVIEGFLYCKPSKLMVAWPAGVKEVSIPSDVSRIFSGAFGGCDAESIFIPNTLKSIDAGAFSTSISGSGCDNLASFTLSDDHPTLSLVDGLLCDKAGKTVIACPAALSPVSLPESITNIVAYAFSGCVGLSRIRIPDEMKTINQHTFQYSPNLEEVIFPNGLTNVDDSAFLRCTALRSVVLPDGLRRIGNYAFSNHSLYESALSEVHIPASVTQIGVPELKIAAFQGHTNIVNVTFPSAFALPTVFPHSYASITNAVVAEGSAIITSNAFFNCSALQTAYIPASVTNIAEGVFGGCKSLERIVLDPENPRYTIVDGALYDKDVTRLIACPAKVTLTNIPDTVTRICDYAFSDSACMETIAIPESVKTIGSFAFQDSLELMSMEIPETVEEIGVDVFAGCVNLSRVIMPEHLKIAPREMKGSVRTEMVMKRGMVYRVTGNIWVMEDAVLTIEPGAIVKFNPDVRIIANEGGTVRAIGTRSSPCIFTSIKDDEHGGDTNGDGDQTIPQPGDWLRLDVYDGGTLELEHVKILYASGQRMGGSVRVLGGGYARIVDSEVAHAGFDAIGVESGGNTFITNCVVRDALAAFRHYNTNEIVNCVVYDCGRITQAGNHQFRNCVFSEITEVWQSSQQPKNFRNCCFWNAGGMSLTGDVAWQTTNTNIKTQDASVYVGRNGNVWGDPLFTDPVNGDFRIQKGSACIDIGSAEYAPELDFYGQPRVTTTDEPAGVALNGGGVPDAGICEMMKRAQMSDVDFAAISVSATGPVAPGGEIDVRWAIDNRGGIAADGSWRDTVSLVSANGRVVTLGEKETTGRIPAGGSLNCHCTFTVPAIAEGVWYPKVQLNTYRDIFEGSLTENNAVTATEPVEVAIAAADMSTAVSGQIAAGIPVVVKLPFAEDAANRLVRMALPAGVSASWGFGFMPQGAASSGAAVAAGSDVCFLAPDGEQTVYVLLESGSTGNYSLTFEEFALRIDTVSPSVVKYGEKRFIIATGTGFTSDTKLVLSAGAYSEEVSCFILSTSEVMFYLDATKYTSGTIINVKALNETVSSTNDGIVSIVDNVGEGKLRFELDIPETARAKRISVGYVEYGNVGNADMVVPILNLVGNGGTVVSLTSHSETFSNSCTIVGVSMRPPHGMLKAGEAVRMPFYFIPGEEYSISLGVLDADNVAERDSVFPTWRSYCEGMAEAATRECVSGHLVYDFHTIYNRAMRMAYEQDATSLSGFLYNRTTSLPMSGETLLLMDTNYTVIATVVTDTEGAWKFRDLPIGEKYEVVAKTCNLCSKTVLTSGKDAGAVRLMAVPFCTFAYKINNLANCDLDRASMCAINQNGVISLAQFTPDGRAVFSNMADGVYDIAFKSEDWCCITGKNDIVISVGEVESNDSERTIDVLPAGIVNVSIVDSNNSCVLSNVVCNLVNEEGGIVAYGITDQNGQVRFDAPPGSYDLTIGTKVQRSDDDKIDVTGAFSTDCVVPASVVPFVIDSSVGEIPLKAAVILIDDGAWGANFTCEWDLDGDGVVDSSDISPTNIYTEAGTYSIGLRVTTSNGRVFNYQKREAVMAWEALPTKMADGAFTIDDNSGYKILDSNAESMTLQRMLDRDVIILGEGDIIVDPAYPLMPRRIRLLEETDSDEIIVQTEYVELTTAYQSLSVSSPLRLLGAPEISKETYPFDFANVSLGVKNSSLFAKGTLSTRNVRVNLWLLDGEVKVFQLILDFKLSVDAGMNVHPSKEAKKIQYGPLASYISGTMKCSGHVKSHITYETSWKHAWFTKYNMPTKKSFEKEITQSGDDKDSKLEFKGEIDGRLGCNIEVGVGAIDPKKDRKATLIDASIDFGVQVKAGVTLSSSEEIADKYYYSYGPYTDWEINVLHAKVSWGKLSFDGAAFHRSGSVKWNNVGDKWEWKTPLPKLAIDSVGGYNNGKVPVTFESTTSVPYDSVLKARSWEGCCKGSGESCTASLRARKQDTVAYDVILRETYAPKKLDFSILDSVGLWRSKLAKKRITVSGPENDDAKNFKVVRRGDQIIIKSKDPNEMAGPIGKGDPDTQRFLEPGQKVTYTVYYENQTNATAAAQEVFVTNSLSQYLDWSTFEMGEVTFGDQIDLGLVGKQNGTNEVTMTGTNLIVRTIVDLDKTKGEVCWYQRVIDPNSGDTWPVDVTGGFLPPNNEETHCGEGHLTYTIKVRDDVPRGVRIDNSATIVFDTNDPITTDPAWWNIVTPEKIEVGFGKAEKVVNEGELVSVSVYGGNIGKASSAKMYIAYNTAASADLDLAKGATGGETPKGGLKFPLALTWAAGEVGEKIVTIPVKTDKTVEGDEFFTLQLAEPVGMELGEGRVCTVTIRDATVAAGKETLQDAVNNAVVKMSTSGKGKWAYAAVGTGGEAAPGKTAYASAMSPVLKAGEMSELKAAAVKGSGTLSFDVRVANDALEGESPEAAEGAAKTVLTLFDGKTVLLAWTNETDWTSASYTVKEEKATSHAFTWQVVQGADTNARAYVANVVWSPADTEMRAITLAAEPAEGGTVAGSGVYPDKTKISLVATANVGYEFIGWYDGETLFDAKAKPSVTLTNDLALTARFEKIPYVRGLADPADGGKVSGSGLCARGKKVTLKASANKNFTFLGWGTGNGEWGTGNGGEYVATTASLVIDRSAKPAADSKTSTTLTNVAEDVTYYAVFKSDPEIFVTVDATDSTGAEPTGKGAGKYVAGTITGMGKYAPGKTKIALKAAANKGYVFAGWLDANGELLTKDATYAIAAMGESDVEYTAKFVTADEDKASIELAVAMGAEAEALGLSTNEIVSITNFCGVAMSWQLVAEALSATTIKVAGLPAGLKFTAKDILKKGSKTEVEIPANTVYGAPTAASKTDKNGNVTPSKVVFTVMTAGKSTQTFAINLYIDPLPAWAVGTFDGAVRSYPSGLAATSPVSGEEPCGTVSLAVDAKGKISGKMLRDDGTWTLSAGEFSRVERVERVDGSPESEAESLVFHATVIGKNGKLLETNEVKVAASGVTGTTLSEAAVTWTAYQNLWKRADTKAEQPVIKKDIKVDHELGEPGDANNKLTLTFKKDGVVAFAGKVDGASVSGSSQLVNDGEGWEVTLYAPKAGFCATFAVTLETDEQKVVTDVTIGGGDAPAGSGSWFTGEFNGYGDAQFPIAGGGTEFLNGLFTINVAANLSFTGTFFGTDGTNATFSGTFAKQVTDGATNYVATGVSITVKGKTMSMGLMCDPQPYAGSDEGFGEIGGGSEDVQDEPCIALNCAWQNIWKRTDLAAEWKPAFASGTEKTLDLKDTWLADLSDGDSLTYAFGADGTVSITGKIYGESVNATATLDLEGLDGSSGTMHCNFFFLANGHLYQQQFTFPRQATVTATDITLDSFVRID